MDSIKTEKQRCVDRFNSLKQEFDGSGWRSSGKDLQKFINQKRGFFDEQPNRGSMINHKELLDGHALGANKTLASGLLSGMTSPSRPWFRLTLDDVTLDGTPGVREWLDEVQKRMVEVMNKSNIYSTLYSSYEELGQFGTSCFIILEDFDSVIRCRSFTYGEYLLGADSRGRINTFGRKFYMTVGQMVKEFGLESCSLKVKAAYEGRRLDENVAVKHLIDPNDERDPELKDYKDMPFRSAYWEDGDGTDTFLAKRGYKKFPVVAARWETTTTDQVYGYGPGWYALGDIKEAQKRKLDSFLMEEKLHKPPVMADSSVTGFVNQLPGGVTKIDSNVPNAGVRQTYQVQNALPDIRLAIQDVHQVIDKRFYVNLFLMFMGIERSNTTAAEIAAREQEKIMMMGPVLYCIQEEDIDASMEIIFSIMSDMGAIPPPPQEAEGMDLKVKYVSILAQAQQALGVQQIQRVISYAAELSKVKPDVLDVLDIDEGIREINSLEGGPSKLVKDKATVDAKRQQDAQMQAQQAALIASNSAADTANKLAKSPVKEEGKTNALEAMMKGMGR